MLYIRLLGCEDDQKNMISVYMYTDVYAITGCITLSNKLLNIIKIQLYVLLRQSLAIVRVAVRLFGNRVVHKETIYKRV